jgi:hypothetical protein
VARDANDPRVHLCSRVLRPALSLYLDFALHLKIFEEKVQEWDSYCHQSGTRWAQSGIEVCAMLILGVPHWSVCLSWLSLVWIWSRCYWTSNCTARKCCV